MKLFSIYRFKSVGSTIQNDEPKLMAEFAVEGTFTSGTNHAARILALKEGESHVVPYEMKEGSAVILDGARVTRLPDHHAGMIAYDEQAKEFVKVTNARCVRDHSPGGFAQAHGGNGMGACVYAPSEAIALRPLIDEIKGEVHVAWTYRAVNPCYLKPVNVETAEKFTKRLEWAMQYDGSKKSVRTGRV